MTPGSRELVKAAKLWAKGTSTKEIAAQLGVSPSWVYTHACNDREMFPRRYHRWSTDAQREDMLRLWKAGMPCKQIASALGVDLNTVYRYTTRRK